MRTQARLPQVRALQWGHSIACELQASWEISLGLSFSISKMEIIVVHIS